ncbi:MAG: DNA helicase, partial [Bowdeniella nasicola]|nr:DNA helicase [Bowdeniella nasicola]
YGATLADGNAADRALRRTERLANQLLPELLDRAEAITTETGLSQTTTVAELREQLEMLQGVREALDIFSPQIFESSAAQMVIATATKQWREEHDVTMRGSTRRRLRKQARDMVRPGRQVDDLHGALIHVQRQAVIWRRHCPGGGWPRLPRGLAATESLLGDVIGELDELSPVLQKDLLHESFDTLLGLMRDLATDVDGLASLPSRTDITARVRELGGQELLEDFITRRLERDQVRTEVELAWWASLLEHMITTDSLLARYSGVELGELAERFRELDRQQVESLVGPVRRAIGRRLQRVVTADKEAARNYYRELAAAHPDNLRSLMGRYRDLTQALRPAWVLTPAQISQLADPDEQLDLVVLDGLHRTPTAHLLGVLARAKQIVVFADPRRHRDGAIGDLADILPHRDLPTDRGDREEHVAAFLAAHGYDGLVDSIPAPPSRSTMRLEVVDGFGMPALGSAAVESVQREVDRVVDLVVDHALTHPQRSLAVITLNERHAARVGEAIRDIVATSPAIADFFAADRPEPFVVTDIAGAQGLARDAIILSVGYGKTPHGRVLHRLGKISGPDGLSLLVDALDAVRRELIVVSCFTHADLDRGRLRAPGAELLYDLLAHIAHADDTPAAAGDDSHDAAPDRLLVDLADRLWRLGLTVVPRYGLPGGVRIPLAIGHPDHPGELFVAVVSDDDAYMAEPSIRVRERHRIERLRQRGWAVYQAFSTSVFLDPQAEAQRIVDLVIEVLTAKQPGSAPAAAELDDQPGQSDPAVEVTTGKEPSKDTAGREPHPRGPRPDVQAGLPLTAYSDDQLDDLVAWIASDRLERSEADFLAELRSELDVTRRGAQIDAVLLTAIQRRDTTDD